MSEEKLSLRQRFRLMDEAAQRKFIKYAGSGAVLVIFGLLMIIIGLFLNTGMYSAGSLLIGFGAIAVLIGIIRAMIGFINPASPVDIPLAPDDTEQPELAEQIFESDNRS
ncbi:MAG TPA: hypothetical protein VFB60_14125 [Ktedonobacteraceae bacterium]|nr:hypothetical protein [Ktedonobacteraceae bacterium]